MFLTTSASQVSDDGAALKAALECIFLLVHLFTNIYYLYLDPLLFGQVFLTTSASQVSDDGAALKAALELIFLFVSECIFLFASASIFTYVLSIYGSLQVFLTTSASQVSDDGAALKAVLECIFTFVHLFTNIYYPYLDAFAIWTGVSNDFCVACRRRRRRAHTHMCVYVCIYIQYVPILSLNMRILTGM